MRGLIDKDIRLLLKRKQTLILFLGIVIVMSLMTPGEMLVGYFSFLIVILIVGTISYDEFDNGTAFLMSLPISRKLYVQSKYLLCIIGELSAWTIGFCIYVLSGFIRKVPVNIGEELPTIAIMIPIVMLMVDLLLPIQLKFGMEKSRVVMATFCVVVAVIIYVSYNYSLSGAAVDDIIATINAISPSVYLIVGFVLFILVTYLSYIISVKVIKKKEY